MTLAVAEMYVMGVSTRKVAKVTQELCGLDITSQQVSRASKLLDDELESTQSRRIASAVRQCDSPMSSRDPQAL